MSDSSVRLAGRLPDGNRNGLASIAHLLVDDPSAVHVAIVLLDCSRVLTSTDDGSTLPTARVRAIEPIPEGHDADEMRRLLRRAIETRTGQTTLPLELERELDDLGLHAAEDEEPRAADARERAAGDDRDDPDAPAEDDELSADDPRRGPLPQGGLFREPPVPPPFAGPAISDDEDSDPS